MQDKGLQSTLVFQTLKPNPCVTGNRLEECWGKILMGNGRLSDYVHG